MQKSFLIILGLVLLVFTPGFAAHLLISEVVVTPSSAEYIEIYNPGPTAVDLTNYYLTDSMDVVGGKPNYTGIVDGTVTPTGAGTDFLVKFPNGATIAPGAYIVISANAFSSQDIPATYKISTYGPSTATPMVVPTNGFVGGSTNGLISNASEAVMLFYWDGTTDTVKDVDYVCWGTSVAYFCDKTGVSTDGPDADSTPTSYLADTPTGNQKPAAGNHAAGYSIQRKQTNPIEVTETFTGGNGLTGHDETSEDFTATASGSFIQSVLRTPGYGMPSDLPPTISGTLYSPGIPTSTDSILIYATVTDDTTGFTVQVKSNVGNYSMSNVSGNLWTAYLPPQPDGTDINFYIEATDTLPQSSRDPGSGYYYIPVRNSLTIVPIATARVATDSSMQTVRGIVIAQPGTYTSSSSYIYIQDTSGGIKVYSSKMRPVVEGDQVTVMGRVITYTGERELELLPTSPGYAINKDTVITLPIPTPKNITTATLNTDSSVQGTLIKFTNVSYAPGWSWASTTTGARITKIDDGSGVTNLWRGDGTGAAAAITEPGSIKFDVIGVAGAYQSGTVFRGPQIQPRRQSDFSANIAIIPPNNMSLHPGDTVAFYATGGTPPYTWTITTTSGTNVGSIVSTGPNSAVFTAGPGYGTCYVTATDAGSKSGNSGIISITPTSAPIYLEPQPVIKRK